MMLNVSHQSVVYVYPDITIFWHQIKLHEKEAQLESLRHEQRGLLAQLHKCNEHQEGHLNAMQTSEDVVRYVIYTISKCYWVCPRSCVCVRVCAYVRVCVRVPTTVYPPLRIVSICLLCSSVVRKGGNYTCVRDGCTSVVELCAPDSSVTHWCLPFLVPFKSLES